MQMAFRVGAFIAVLTKVGVGVAKYCANFYTLRCVVGCMPLLVD